MPAPRSRRKGSPIEAEFQPDDGFSHEEVASEDPSRTDQRFGPSPRPPPTVAVVLGEAMGVDLPCGRSPKSRSRMPENSSIEEEAVGDRSIDLRGDRTDGKGRILTGAREREREEKVGRVSGTRKIRTIRARRD